MKTIKCCGEGYECVCGSECNGIDAANLRSLTPTPAKVDALRAAAAKWEARANASARKESPAVRELGRIVARLVDKHEG